MEQKLYDIIDKNAEEYAAMLTRWLKIPSVKGKPCDDAPFGKDVRKMLDVALDDCEKMGFEIRNFDGYAGDATLKGTDNEAIAVLAHLDVVPAGDGWDVPPYEAHRDGDKITARGTSDDKGPALCALFAMKAIKEAGIQLKKSVRLILGCDEESGWEDMDYYANHTQMPEVGFSPDASFPCINTEKAMLSMKLNAALPSDGLKVISMNLGERPNIILGEGTCLVEGNDDVIAKTEAFAKKTGLPYTAKKVDEGIQLFAQGIAGHSAYPWGRRSAVGMMLLLLKELGVTGPLSTLCDVVGSEHDGNSLGIKCTDEISGELTCNMGILHVKNGRLFATLDCRVPVSADLNKLAETAISHLKGIEVEFSTKVAHHVDADSELVSNLLAAYKDETGVDAKPEYTGGGTYAKVLKQGVAFGASFPEDADLAHQANEYILVSQMVKATKIYCNAILRLCR